MISIIELNHIISDVNPHKVFRICCDETIQTSNETIEIDGAYILDIFCSNNTEKEILRHFISGLYDEKYKDFTYLKSEYTKGQDNICKQILQIEREYKLNSLLEYIKYD